MQYQIQGETGINVSIFFNKKFSSGLFGGEGVFNTLITDPGHVWFQTMPTSNVAGILRPYFPVSH